MSYLLDSDVTADYLKGLPQTVQQIQPLVQSGIGISIITYGEIYDGIAGSYNPKAAEQVFRQFLRVAVVLPLNRSVMRRFATERRILRLQGQKLDDMDMLIAATAMEHNLTLITRNARHFGRIQGLVWQQP
jgi:tRNA(fMet)-specific endonuclease VapC